MIMKKIRFLSFLLVAIVIVPLIISCGSDDSDDKVSPVDYVKIYEQKLLGSWNLLNSTVDGKESDLTNYKQIVHFNNDMTFQKDIYDYSLSKIPITANSEITSIIYGKYEVKKDGNNYKLCMKYNSTKSVFYYLISFSNNENKLFLNETDNQSNYLVVNFVFDRIR